MTNHAHLDPLPIYRPLHPECDGCGWRCEHALPQGEWTGEPLCDDFGPPTWRVVSYTCTLSVPADRFRAYGGSR